MALEEKGISNLLFQEMALFVQFSTPDIGIDNVVNEIIGYRQGREVAENKRVYDRQKYEKAVTLHEYAEQTFRDYADVNFRYLRATGLFISKGRSLAVNPERHLFIQKLLDIPDYPGDESYIYYLTNGAVLPTDNQDEASLVLHDLISQLHILGGHFDLSGKNLDNPGNIAIVRHEVEQSLFEIKENNYAKTQVTTWEEIAVFLELIAQRRRSTQLDNGDEVEIPSTEYPAYLEWTLWRAFLAINELVNKPYEVRRFKIDQDFLPVGTAPGNGPDLICEFEDYVLVIEATLMGGSRQEAAEGEPVRRHVAQLAEQHHGGKPVVGLFVANKVDSNTAETFRVGSWFAKNDARMSLTIVPLTIDQFRLFFISLFEKQIVDNRNVLKLLEDCARYRSSYTYG
jgi:hypothetical protein